MVIHEQIYVGIMFGVPLVFAIWLFVYMCYYHGEMGEIETGETEPLLG